MNILIILIPCALMLGLGFLVAFMVSSWQGQYEDLDTPAYRMLVEEDRPLNLHEQERNPHGV